MSPTTPPVIRAGRAATGVVVVSVLVAAAAMAAGLALGWRPVAIRTGSMQPTIGVGALVLAREVPASSVRPGQVVTFRSADRGSVLVTHRVVAVDRTGDLLTVTTKGDANTVSETWTAAPSARLGRAGLVVPQLGRVLLAPRPWYAVAAVLVLTMFLGVPLVRSLTADEERLVPPEPRGSGT